MVPTFRNALRFQASLCRQVKQPGRNKNRPRGGTFITGVYWRSQKNVNQSRCGLSPLFPHGFMHFGTGSEPVVQRWLYLDANTI